MYIYVYFPRLKLRKLHFSVPRQFKILWACAILTWMWPDVPYFFVRVLCHVRCNIIGVFHCVPCLVASVISRTFIIQINISRVSYVTYHLLPNVLQVFYVYFTCSLLIRRFKRLLHFQIFHSWSSFPNKLYIRALRTYVLYHVYRVV